MVNKNLGELLKPCPFCGRKMVFYRETYINKHGNKVTEQYYMHDMHKGERSDCILDKICMPFVIGAGDADLETGYIGEYAKQWNRRE